MAAHKIFDLIENYIYLYHTETFIILPGYADSITDTLPVNFAQNNPMSRSAPLYSYSNSGPRSVQVSLNLHRDMMWQVNYQKSNLPVTVDEDYVDVLIAQVQAAALPRYAAAEKMVDPPIVAVRFGNDIFCKGVVQGGIGLTYKLPVLRNGKYSQVDLSFTINEIDPYGADEVMTAGSFRGLDATLERNIFKGAVTL